MNKLLFIALTLFALCSCEKQTIITYVDPQNTPYITEYYIPTEVEIFKDCGYLNMKFSGERCRTWGTTEEREKSKAIGKLYGDSTSRMWDPGMHPALAYPIDKMTISCNQDFDSHHLAGEPLDDIVQLDFATYYPFIKGGYEPFTVDYTKWLYDDLVRYTLCFNCVNADITHLTCVGKKMNHDGADSPNIQFKSTPDVAGEYTFNLAVTINGEVMTTSFTTTFE